ncbi:transposase [Stratiformator vulcanicus]|uniref:Transposase IS200 like protein n=1 Tax=Stratiformator vulcanicus TaxID=2527980 RepID=A0A517R4L1_9PLAN|nr:transposase [Stratiformator vulcanicus]QDT38814.1 Transposase IS200 like protein [Stratiformator vulcanicus]
MRHWLLTNTTYGTWLPGDRRGFVTSVRDRRPGESPSISRREHDQPLRPYDRDLPGLYRSAMDNLKGPPILLDGEKAELILAQFQETAAYRAWSLLAASIMPNHFHLVVQVENDPDPKKLLSDFKAYASRKLNANYERPQSDTWWTTKGSKRKLNDAKAVQDAINYVLYKQPNPLVVWCSERGRFT